MKISLDWLSDYIDTTSIRADLKGFSQKLAMRGIEVEAIHNLSQGFDKVIVAEIETRDKHPNADRLSVCKVKTGTETLQIVCGANNMKAGDKVALSLPGAHLPNGANIDKGKIRNVESFGMLCSEVELGLATQSEGILILPANATLGQPLADFLGRNDTVLELGVTPNRGDILSHLGFAREAASILGLTIKFPEPKLTESSAKTDDKIRVKIDSPELCHQYHARHIEGVRVGPSPEWLKKRLAAIGQKSISNVVDVTNYVLMEWGTPLHAFDYSKIQGAQILVRPARTGEKLALLDRTQVELKSSDLVIADATNPVALAGVMGGEGSEVGPTTTSVLLEAAQFLPASVRKTSKAHQKQTDAAYRFERGVDFNAVTKALDRAAALISEVAGGQISKGRVSVIARPATRRKAHVSTEKLNRFLGLSLSPEEVVKNLKLVGFKPDENFSTSGDVEIPSYRPDVENFEDLCEEVLRVWGYDKVQATVPRLDYIPEPTAQADVRAGLIAKLRQSFSDQGFHEAVNFSFTSKLKNDTWGGPRKDLAVTLENPINEDLTTMKTSLVGSLFDGLVLAKSHQETDIRLFEIRPIYTRDTAVETGIREEWMVAGILTGRSYVHPLQARDSAVDFFDAKGAVEAAIEVLGARGLRIEPLAKPDERLHPAQTAAIALGRGACGFVGRLHPKIEAEHKFTQPVFVFEFSLDRALEVSKTERRYSAISKFPKVHRDFSLIIPEKMRAQEVTQAIQKVGKPLVEEASVVDLYSGEKIGPGLLSLSVSLILGNPERTLEEAEIEILSKKILSSLEHDLGIKLRLQ